MTRENSTRAPWLFLCDKCAVETVDPALLAPTSCCPKCGASNYVDPTPLDGRLFCHGCNDWFTPEPASEVPEQIRARQEKAFAEADIGLGPMQSEAVGGKEAVPHYRPNVWGDMKLDPDGLYIHRGELLNANAHIASLQAQCEQLKRGLDKEKGIFDKLHRCLNHDFKDAEAILGRRIGHMSVLTDEITKLRADVLRLEKANLDLQAKLDARSSAP